MPYTIEPPDQAAVEPQTGIASQGDIRPGMPPLQVPGKRVPVSPEGEVGSAQGAKPKTMIRDPSIGPRRQAVVDYWKGKGVPEHVAEGIADRVNAESGFNPTETGDGGTSAGLYQHHAERKSALQSLPNWQDPKTQNDFAYSEVTGGDATAAAHWDEIKGAKTREEAARLWDQYFERSASGPGSKRTGSSFRTIGAGNWNVSDKAIGYEQGRRNTSVRWMSPDDYLAMVPEIKGDSDNRAKRKSLLKSLAMGDDVEAIPTLDVKLEGKKLKVIDQDGRNRATAAKEAGVDLIPVALHGIGDGTGSGDYKEIEGMRGGTRSFDFAPVSPVPHGTSREPPLNLVERAHRLFARDKAAAVPQGAPGAERAYVNDAGQPFTAVAGQGAPQPQPGTPASQQPQIGPQQQEYRPTLLPFSLEGGFHPVLPEIIQAPMVGIQQAGQMMRGERPSEPTPELESAAMLGAGMAPGSRLVPRNELAAMARPADIAPEGQNMLAAAQAGREMGMIQRPSPISQERAALAREAIDRFDIPLTTAEIDPAQTLPAAAIRGLPGSGDAPRRQMVHEGFNRAVAKEMGESTPIVNQQVMKDARTRIGDGLERIESSAPRMPLTRGPIVREVNDILRDATIGLTKEEYGVIERNARNIFFDSQGKQRKALSGEVYGNLMHRDAPLDKATRNANPNVAGYAERIKDALRDLLAAHLSPEDLADYRSLRYQWKVMKTIEPLVLKETEGNISPALLNAQVSKHFDNRAYDVSGTPLDRLGKIGQAFLKEPRTSGTSERGTALWTAGKIGAAGAGLLTGHMVGIPLLHEALAAGLTIGAARGFAAMMAKPGRVERLIENALTRIPPSPGAKRNAIGAMMSARGANTLRQFPPPPSPPQQPPPIGMRQSGAPPTSAPPPPGGPFAQP